MKHQNMYSRIMTLNQKFNQENPKLTKSSNKSKFEALRKWSIDNGSIFQETIDFPIKYGPFGYDGVKSKREIKDNEAILFIPRKQMIISKDYEHLFSFLYDNKEEKEDRSNIVLTLALIIEEEKGKEEEEAEHKRQVEEFVSMIEMRLVELENEDFDGNYDRVEKERDWLYANKDHISLDELQSCLNRLK